MASFIVMEMANVTYDEPQSYAHSTLGKGDPRIGCRGMGVIWHKIWRDLINNKARTALVVVSTAVGIFALGLVFGLSGTMGERLTAAHHEAIPAHITFQGGPFSLGAINAIEHERGVRSAQGEIVVPLRWRLGSDDADGTSHHASSYNEGLLVARQDYDDQSMDLLRLLKGRWPGGRVARTHAYAVGLDRLSIEHFCMELGTPIYVEAGQRERQVSVTSVVYAYDVLSPAWGGTATFYATPEVLARLTDYEHGQGANRLQVRLDAFSQESAEKISERIESRLEWMGLAVDSYEITDPGVHPMQDMVDAVLIVLGVMGALSLGLSGFLIINIINAILARQIDQIGVMKAIGATLLRIARIYLTITLIYGALALFLAVPLGIIGTHWVSSWLLDKFNVTIASFRFEPLAVAIQIAIGLAVPPAAALAPVLNAARLTVREAISDYGLQGSFGDGWLDQLVAQIRGLPRFVALGLRNAFRRKGRVALTLVMLTLSGAMFTMVMSTRKALNSTFQVIFELEGDLAIFLERPYPVSRLIEIAEDLRGVNRAEVWNGAEAKPVSKRGKGEEPAVTLTGVPADSAMFKPRIIDGRSLAPGDGRAVLVNNRLAAEEGVEIGDVLTLEIAGKESDWTVVGSYLSLNVLHDICFVPRESLGRETQTRGEGTAIKILSDADGAESQRQVIERLTETLEAQNVEVSGSWSAQRQWQESQSAFGALIHLLLTMAVLVAIVGSIGLMSTMSINVVERTREIGVMRAIGATTPAVVTIFVVEGVLVGILSWLLAVPLSAPGAYALGYVVGQSIVQIPLDFAYSTNGMLLWLLIVVTLSALASLWPALHATRLSVRESLAYE